MATEARTVPFLPTQRRGDDPLVLPSELLGSLRPPAAGAAPPAQAPAALASQVRPGLVLPEVRTRALLTAAARHDVGQGGCFSAGPAGVQVFDAPFDGVGGTRGSSLHLGSVDWSYDTPTRHYATIYRVMVTAAGVEAGRSVTALLKAVLDLIGEPLPPPSGMTAPAAPARDPFRTGRF